MDWIFNANKHTVYRQQCQFQSKLILQRLNLWYFNHMDWIFNPKLQHFNLQSKTLTLQSKTSTSIKTYQLFHGVGPEWSPEVQEWSPDALAPSMQSQKWRPGAVCRSPRVDVVAQSPTKWEWSWYTVSLAVYYLLIQKSYSS